MVVRDVVRLRLTSSQTESENVPEFRRTLPVPVEHLSYLAVVKDFRSVGLVDVHHGTLRYLSCSLLS